MGQKKFISEEYKDDETYKSKKYIYWWIEPEDKDFSIVENIIADKDFPELEGIVIGDWGTAWGEEDGSQRIVNEIVKYKDKFSHIKSLFIGDMDSEESEISWIVQANYSKLYDAMPQLEKLTIKGSTSLNLGELKHDNLKSLEIICGGLPLEVIDSIKNAKLPSLESLVLWVGCYAYGFDGDEETIKELIEKMNFPKLKRLGIINSEFESDIVKFAFESSYAKQVERFDFSCGVLSDEGGQYIFDNISKYPNIKQLDLHYHYMTREIMDKLKNLFDELGIIYDMSDERKFIEYGVKGTDNYHIYGMPMLTE